MDLQNKITMKSFDEETDVAGYVVGLLRNLELDSALTMTIIVGPYGGFSVLTATDTSSEGTEQETVARFFSSTQVNT